MAAAKWTAEIIHRNDLWMNHETALARGIHDGDIVKLVSRVGQIEARVRLTQGIHPRVVALPIGSGHWGMGRIARAERFRSEDDPDTRLLWWKGNSPDRHPNVLVPASPGLAGAGQAWHDTVVKVVRV
jgi:anaerobic selenocysteine-containing dehydrogenase